MNCSDLTIERLAKKYKLSHEVVHDIMSSSQDMSEASETLREVTPIINYGVASEEEER
jgi:hypothetical protein